MAEAAKISIISEAHREHIEERVLAEQVALMCRLTTSPLTASVVIGAMMVWLTMEDYGAGPALVWYIALLLVLLLRWRIAATYLRKPRGLAEIHRWRRAMLAAAVLGGATWSVAGSFLLPHDPTREIVMSVFFIGCTAAGMGSQAPVRKAYACLLIPFCLPYIVTQLLLGGDRLAVALAFMVYIPVVLVIAKRQTDSIERQIRLAIENESLAEQLRQERDRANQARLDLEVQLDEQKRSTQRIRELNVELERQAHELRTANNDLEGFSYSVSHDLRAPLRAIDGFSQLLVDDKTKAISSETRHHLQRIRANVAHMASLIDDLLEFARCGRQSLEFGRLDMVTLAGYAAEQARSTRLNEAVMPTIEIGELPAARGDEGLIRQVWVNLLDNAVKYTSKVDSPRIVVSGYEESERLVYEIRDNGVGFDSAFSSNLFGVFRRLHGAREYPGSGVGLAIVQRIVTRHGGEVWAKAEPNKGATFSFSLPKPVLRAVG
ncbi:two-component sensor histidine kinase [Steroidobacter agaridevorans]|uniref:histidine kinase n=1 Tax=Steroidobacter agaridevorans TaxID=2695856 RepID=A0A829YE59_9GAMM|nr:ATP-binding protein [Steroidobacter agaridevorans]GFE81101.1 two-component sensor histidine kinase [Steroidobacter agaridevorans]